MPGVSTIDLKKNLQEVDRVITVLRHRERTPANHIDSFYASYLKLYRKHIPCILEAYTHRWPQLQSNHEMSDPSLTERAAPNDLHGRERGGENGSYRGGP